MDDKGGEGGVGKDVLVKLYFWSCGDAEGSRG